MCVNLAFVLMHNVNMDRNVRSRSRSHSRNGRRHRNQRRLFLNAELSAFVQLGVPGEIIYILALSWEAGYLNESTYTADGAEFFAGEMAVTLSFRARGWRMVAFKIKIDRQAMDI